MLIAVIKILFLYLAYFIATMYNDIQYNYHRSTECTSYPVAQFSGKWPLQDQFDLWFIVWAGSTPLCSFLSKASVRMSLQNSGLSLPSFVGPVISLALILILENTAGPIPWWGKFDHEMILNSTNISITVGIFLTGLISFALLTHYTWFDTSWVYPLERDVFVLPSYRPMFTTVFTLLNRRTLDLEAEDEEFNKDQIDPLSFRNRVGSKFITKKTSIWDKGQHRPYIFICTTLWHEEDFEMRTLLRSVTRLLRHARQKLESGENGYDLEMHVFFDNCFETRKRSGNISFMGTDEWTEVNKYVTRFLAEFRTVLDMHNDDKYLPKRLLEQGKIIRTPYGGRVEYEVAGFPFVIHLKAGLQKILP